MENPVLIEVMRGDVVESRHRGAFVVVDGDGAIVMQAGDITRPVFPRSAVKAIQALPLVESGAADAYGFGDADLAMACASHSGEAAHARRAAGMLARAGLDAAALECGAHWPTGQAALIALARESDAPSALHNNCSGKHAGFLCTCRHLGIDHRFYVGAGHRAQEMVREAMEALTGAAHESDLCGTDGCSIPTYAVPLASLADAFSRMATGRGLGPERAKAAQRLLNACMAQPFFVAGTGRADTQLMQAMPGRIFSKVGAEGVHCAVLPQTGVAIALKCDDGAGRASEAMAATLLQRLVGEAGTALDALARPVLTNWNGIEVGALRPAGPLA